MRSMGAPRVLERREFQQGIRADAHRGRALPQLDGAVAAGAHRRGQLEHGAGAHRALGALHGDVHFALHARDDDVAGVERVRRGRAEQRRACEHSRKPIPNYMSHRELIMVITGHSPIPLFVCARIVLGEHPSQCESHLITSRAYARRMRARLPTHRNRRAQMTITARGTVKMHSRRLAAAALVIIATGISGRGAQAQTALPAAKLTTAPAPVPATPMLTTVVVDGSTCLRRGAPVRGLPRAARTTDLARRRTSHRRCLAGALRAGRIREARDQAGRLADRPRRAARAAVRGAGERRRFRGRQRPIWPAARRDRRTPRGCAPAAQERRAGRAARDAADRGPGDHGQHAPRRGAAMHSSWW